MKDTIATSKDSVTTNKESVTTTEESVTTTEESVTTTEQAEFVDHGSPELKLKASLYVGVFFVPGMLILYVFCRYVPDKIIDATD